MMGLNKVIILTLSFIQIAGCNSPKEITVQPQIQTIEPSSTAQRAFRREGYLGLSHFTRANSFAEILKTGALEPRLNPIFGEQAVKPNKVIYLGAFKSQDEFQYVAGDNFIVLLFSLKLLERDDYHLSIEWLFGDFIEGKSFDPKHIEEFFKAKSATQTAMEIVFHKPISIRQISGIIASKGREDSIRKLLNQYELDIPITTY